MTQRHLPPSRRSISQTVSVCPLQPTQPRTYSGRVQASKSSRFETRKSRSIRISRSDGSEILAVELGILSIFRVLSLEVVEERLELHELLLPVPPKTLGVDRHLFEGQSLQPTGAPLRSARL